MKFYDKEDAARLMNVYAADGIPFIFIISYSGRKALVMPVDEVDSDELLYSFGGCGNYTAVEGLGHKFTWNPQYPDYCDYKVAFGHVRDGMLRGDSYLANLTCRIPVDTDLDLKEIYMSADAPYRLWIKDTLVCFSPEKFVTIADGIISSYPMKGTIDATLPDAEKTLLADVKEAAEHATIVDLIRNDLSMVADRVRVSRYRYVERLVTHRGALLQTSSEITGCLPDDYVMRIGDILFALLPAGSITGAPKPRTVELIAEAERYDRGFYTGVMGLCHGGRVDSAVMIRFIDTDDCGRLCFKAGGGITAKSDCRAEYEEVMHKTYVPITL